MGPVLALRQGSLAAAMSAPTQEPTYTLDEARWRLAEQECSMHGHSWDVVSMGGIPRSIVCDRCRRTYAVVPVSDA